MPEVNNDNFNRKIVIRRLPPTLTKEKFLNIISPVPEHDYFYYCDADQRFDLCLLRMIHESYKK